MKEIYFDHSATTPVDPSVVEAMLPYLKDRYGNPSSNYRLGKEARHAMENAREQVAALIGAHPDEIIFTSGGTEANNLAILGTAYKKWEKGRHIITSAIEHRAVLEPCKFLRSQGFDVTFLPVDESGMVDPGDVEEAIRTDTILVSIMHANNEIGTIQPVEEIGKIAKERGITFHCDAVQSIGRIPVDVEKLGCDMLSISAHKLYGPKGVGCLYLRKGTEIVPLITGGGQERDLRGGTENLPGMVGFGRAAELAGQVLQRSRWEMVFLRDRIIEGISERIPNSFLNGHRFQRLPGHVSFSFSNVDGRALISMLDEKGIAASHGSACHSDSPGPSHVLKALGYSDELAQSTLRITLGRDNDDHQVDYLLAILPDIIDALRDISPGFRPEAECPCQDQPSGYYHE
ncbi:MAG: cysteine desulfurase NifS [Bacillota bacterium]